MRRISHQHSPSVSALAWKTEVRARMREAQREGSDRAGLNASDGRRELFGFLVRVPGGGALRGEERGECGGEVEVGGRGCCEEVVEEGGEGGVGERVGGVDERWEELNGELFDCCCEGGSCGPD